MEVKKKKQALPNTRFEIVCLIYTKEPFIQVTNKPKPKVMEIIITNTNEPLFSHNYQSRHPKKFGINCVHAAVQKNQQTSASKKSIQAKQCFPSFCVDSFNIEPFALLHCNGRRLPWSCKCEISFLTGLLLGQNISADQCHWKTLEPFLKGTLYSVNADQRADRCPRAWFT